MSVISVIIGSVVQQPEGELDERGNRRYMRHAIVLTDDPLDGIQIVGDAPGLPQQYSTYQFGNDVDLGATLRRIRPVLRPDTTTTWDVFLEYDSALGSADSGEREPTLRRRKKRWSATSYEIPFEMDRFGNVVANSAHDEFDPPPMTVRHGWKLTYQKNVATEADVGGFYGYLECVNEDQFQGFAPKTCCLVDVDASEEFDNNQFYWDMTLTFEFRVIIPNPNAKVHEVNANGTFGAAGPYFPWNKTELNAGLMAFEGDPNAGPVRKIRILDNDSRPVPQPVRLALNGTLMPFSSPRSESIYLSWQQHELKPFAPLGIV